MKEAGVWSVLPRAISVAVVAALGCAPPSVVPVAKAPASSVSSPEGNEAARPAPAGAVDVLAPPASASARPPVATQPSAAPPPPLDPPCKLTKGASSEEGGAARGWASFAGEAPMPERSLLGLPTAAPARVSPEILQRPLRDRFSCFRGCYHQGLARKPDLQGRVVVDFAIEASTGKVKSVADRGSTLPDKAVIACILEEMKLVRFPAPGGKEVRVVYPLLFVPPKDE